MPHKSYDDSQASALEESEQRYERLLSAVTSYRYTVRLKEGIPVATEHTVGCLAATGYGPEDYACDAYLWFSMIHPDDRTRVSRHLQAVLAAQAVPPIEHRILHRNGTSRWIRDTMLLHHDGQGKLDRYDGLVEDITERRRLEQQLLANKASMIAAQRIQESLLPQTSLHAPGMDVSGTVWPAEVVAGDYFDCFQTDDGSVIIAVGDVSGHGVGPGLLMAFTHAIVRALSRMHVGLDEILRSVNTALLENQTEQFVTLLLGHVSPTTGALAYLSAGHPSGYVLDGSGHVKARLESQTVPLGISTDIVFPTPPSVRLEPGDVVLFVSDGILEAMDPAGETFGSGRLLATARELLGQGADQIVAGIRAAVSRFVANQNPRDDMTVLVLERSPDSNSHAS